MQLRRIFSTFFLLMAYLLGYAHSLLPHGMGMGEGDCVLAAEQGRAILHRHQELCTDAFLPLAEQHSACISHIDHCDEDLLDFLICLLAETHAPDDGFVEAHQLPAKASFGRAQGKPFGRAQGKPFGKSYKFVSGPACVLPALIRVRGAAPLSALLLFYSAEDEPLPPAPFFGHAILRGPPLS